MLHKQFDMAQKIGTTRRLDPHERIAELGSASVPFRFNTNCVVFSEDAFALEKNYTKHFIVKGLIVLILEKNFLM